MPSDTIMPCTSSGEVSLRHRITFSPRCSTASAASSAVKYTLAHRRARRCRQALGDHGHVLGRELRVQHLVEVLER